MWITLSDQDDAFSLELISRAVETNRRRNFAILKFTSTDPRARPVAFRRDDAGRFYVPYPGWIVSICTGYESGCETPSEILHKPKQHKALERCSGRDCRSFVISQDGGLFALGSPENLLLAKTVVEASALVRSVATVQTNHRDAEIRLDVLKCYNYFLASARVPTLEEMRGCAGVWVTPRALVSCTATVRCPVIDDSLEGRAALDAVLKFDGLTRNSLLKPKANDAIGVRPTSWRHARRTARMRQPF